MAQPPSAEEQIGRLYGEVESRAARAAEQLVARDSFGELLARATENVVALTKLGNDSVDLVLRNLRVAGRQDVARLGRQLARTEDKLELVLQEVERLQQMLAERDGGPSSRPRRNSGGGGATRGGAAATRGDGRGSRSRSGKPSG